MTPVEGGLFQGDALHEHFFVKLNSTYTSIVADTLVKIHRGSFEKLTMYDLIYTIEQRHGDSSALACLLEPLESLLFPQLVTQMDLAHVELMPSIPKQVVSENDSLEGDLDKLVNRFLQLYASEYTLLVNGFLTGVVNGPARRRLNHCVEDWQHNLTKNAGSAPGSCAPWPKNDDGDTPDYFDFRTWDMLPRFNRLLNKPATLQAMDSYVDCAEGYAESKLLPMLGSTDRSVLLGGGMTLIVRSFRIDNFGSIDECSTHWIR